MGALEDPPLPDWAALLQLSPHSPPSPVFSQREKLWYLTLLCVLLAHGSAWQSLSLLVSSCLSTPSPLFSLSQSLSFTIRDHRRMFPCVTLSVNHVCSCPNDWETTGVCLSTSVSILCVDMYLILFICL